MKKAAILLPLTIIVVLLLACDKMSSPAEGGGSNAGMGENNTREMAVTGGVVGVGMTYADLKGYVNIPTEVIVDASAKRLMFRVGVWYGENKYSLNTQAFGQRSDREFTVTVPNVMAGKTYYYQSFLEVGDYVYSYELDGYVPYFETLGLGSEIGYFTTKELKYDGAISAGDAGDVTFFNADISGKVDVSSLDAKETYRRGFVWSANKSAITGQLASILEGGRYEDTPGYQIINMGEGYLVNDDVHFFVGDQEQVRLYSEPGVKLYYTPFLVISGKSFACEPKEVTMRSLAQTSGMVDLGLSCQWSATNCAAASPWEMGTTKAAGFTSDDVAQQFGSGQRLPTKEEVEELNSRCSFEEMDNGVLVTGPNGNQIFIPGQSLEDSYSSSISLIPNTYLSSSTRSEYVLGSWDYYQIGYYYSQNGYMDTTDLPILSYPYNMNQHYYLRPVRGESGGGSSGGGSGDGGETGDISSVLGVYKVDEYGWSNTYRAWEYSSSYEVEISKQSQNDNQVFISNLWESESIIFAEVLDSGNRITIPAGQILFTHNSYGDVWIFGCDPDTGDIASDGEIVLTYDPDYNVYHSSPFAPYCNSGYFGFFEVLMRRK